jgi:hypothetical protein
LLVCEFRTIWPTFACFCEIRLQIDLILLRHEIRVNLCWICYFISPFDNLSLLHRILALWTCSIAHPVLKHTKNTIRLLVCEFGTIWPTFAWFCEYDYKSIQFHFYMKSVSIYVKFATLYHHLTIYRSFIEYWPYGRVALHIQCKNIRKHNSNTRIWIWDYLASICMVLRNKATNRLNFTSTCNPCQFLLNLLLYVFIWQFDTTSSNTGLMDV